ncbi:MAG: DUF6768 family protein [Thermoanaerobaculia bacterium]
MDDLDRKIEEALSAEDRTMLEKFGEQGVLGQWFGVYRGAMGGLAVLATILTFALVLAAGYCGWKLFGASEALDAARWGAGTVLLLAMVGYLKLWFLLRMESNRVLREVKRLELQIARGNVRS